MLKTESETFLHSNNISTLWEVIIDNERPTVAVINELRSHFIEAVKQFNDIGYHPDLFQMNKKFLTLFLSSNKAKSVVPITAEEIQQDKKTQFERELNAKQHEFNTSINKVIPPAPKFQDDMDTPISEMEKLIAETMAQRNFDIEQIQQSVNKNWMPKQEESSNSNPQSTPIKYIKIGEEIEKDGILPLKEKKTLTWAENLEENVQLSIHEDSSRHIFSKLKSMPDKNDIILDTLTELHKKMDLLLEKLTILENK